MGMETMMFGTTLQRHWGCWQNPGLGFCEKCWAKWWEMVEKCWEMVEKCWGYSPGLGRTIPSTQYKYPYKPWFISGSVHFWWPLVIKRNYGSHGPFSSMISLAAKWWPPIWQLLYSHPTFHWYPMTISSKKNETPLNQLVGGVNPSEKY